MNTLKQCLHYDPDSKPCLTLHRLTKSLEKSYTQLEGYLSKEDWRGAIRILTGSGKNFDLMKRFDDALEANTLREQLIFEAPTTTKIKAAPIPLPDAKKFSPRRQTLVRALCKSYTQAGEPRKGQAWCAELLTMDGCAEDVDGLVGQAEVFMLDEEWEEAVRAYEKAFEASGRGNRDVRARLLLGTV